MSDFRSKLQSAVSLELTEKRRADPEGIADMVEAIVNSLGLVIAVAAKGDRDSAQTLLTGAESYLYETVTQHSPLAKIITGANKR